MENKKIKQIGILLRKDNVSELDIKKRLKIFENLSSKVSKLMKEDPKFKGFEIFGSLLNEYFNPNSDIDVNFLLKNSKIYSKKCSCHKNYYFHIEDSLKTKFFNVYNYVDLTEEVIKNMSNFDDYTIRRIMVPFGVFIGDKNYRIYIAGKVIKKIEENKLVNEWSKVVHQFSIWNHRDLTNPKENYRLSSFEKLIRDYKIN